MKLTVIGPGRWGSFIAFYLKERGHDVLLYGRNGSAAFSRLRTTRQNDLLTFPEDMRFSSDLQQALAFSDIILILSLIHI